METKNINYLVIKNNTIIQLFTSSEELLEYLEVKITDQGIVEITDDGRQLPHSYNMNFFNKEQIKKDIILNHLKKIEVIISQIGIFKLQRI